MNRSPGEAGAQPIKPVSPVEIPRLPAFLPAAVNRHATATVPSVLDGRDFLLTTSGRAAIYLALRALGVGSGGAVLVPTYHCPTMVSPVVALGAQPVFYGIDAEGLPRLDTVDSAQRPTIRAMLVAHWFGLPLDLTDVAAWCQKRGIALVEDCAHAFFGEVNGRPLGTAGTFAVASLTKFFPVPEGGCLIGSSDSMQAIHLKRAGGVNELRRIFDVIEVGAKYGGLGWSGPIWRALIALKARARPMKSAEAMMASAPGERAFSPEPLDEAACRRRPARVVDWIVRRTGSDSQVAARRRNYEALASQLSGLRGGRPLRPDLPAGACPYVFPFFANHPEPAYRTLRAAGVPVFRWDYRWPGTPLMAEDAGHQWADHVLQLGCHQDISPSQIERMAALTQTLMST